MRVRALAGKVGALVGKTQALVEQVQVLVEERKFGNISALAEYWQALEIEIEHRWLALAIAALELVPGNWGETLEAVAVPGRKTAIWRSLAGIRTRLELSKYSKPRSWAYRQRSRGLLGKRMDVEPLEPVQPVGLGVVGLILALETARRQV